jgi:hypothetical protein
VDSTAKKVALGLIAFMPIAAIFAIAIHLAMVTHGRTELAISLGPLELMVPRLSMDELIPMAIAIGVTALVQMAIAIPFILHVHANPRLAPTPRIVWTLAVLFVGSIADPIYWATQVLERHGPRRPG